MDIIEIEPIVSALDMVPEQGEWPATDAVISIAAERLRSHREVRAVAVDLIEFMERSASEPTDGVIYEITRRAALLRGLIAPDFSARQHERLAPTKAR